MSKQNYFMQQAIKLQGVEKVAALTLYVQNSVATAQDFVKAPQPDLRLVAPFLNSFNKTNPTGVSYEDVAVARYYNCL